MVSSFRAWLAVHLREDNGPGRFERQSLLGTELAVGRAEAHADRVVGHIVEQHQVVAAVAVEIGDLEHGGTGPRVRQSLWFAQASLFSLQDDDHLLGAEQGQVVAAVAVQVADRQGIGILDGLARVDPQGIAE